VISRILVKPFGGIWKLKQTCNNTNSKLMKKIYKFIYNLYQFEHGSAISYDSQIDGVLNLPYGMKQIIISPDVKIGKNCVIFPQVHIIHDRLIDSKTFGTPTIGDNCYIKSGAKIIGNIKIGNNVQIEANCVVTQDIPDNHVVSFSPLKISKIDKTPDNRLYSFQNGKWIYYDNGNWIDVKDNEILMTFDRAYKS